MTRSNSAWLLPGLALLGLGILANATFLPDQLSARGWATTFLYGTASIPVYVLVFRAAQGTDKWFGLACVIEGVLILSRVPALGGTIELAGLPAPRWLALSAGLALAGWLTVSALERRGYIRR